MPSWGRLGESLIFLISQPRAGSTLLQKILGSHSAIHTCSEPWVALHPLFGLRESGIATDYGARLALIGVNDFLEHLPEGQEAWWEAVRLMLGHLYSRALAPSGKDYFLDKTPRYYLILPELRRVFPRARFVFLLRNPVAVLASAIEAWAWDDCPQALRRFRHDLSVAPSCIVEAMRAMPDACTVRYEDLAAGPIASISALCRRLGLPFEPSMVEYGNSPAGQALYRFGDTGTVYRESRPVSERIDRWKQTLQSPIRQAWAHGYIRSLGAPLFTALGYDYDEADRAFPPRAGWEHAWSEIVRPAGFPRTEDS